MDLSAKSPPPPRSRPAAARRRALADRLAAVCPTSPTRRRPPPGVAIRRSPRYSAPPSPAQGREVAEEIALLQQKIRPTGWASPSPTGTRRKKAS
ncbi:MAG: hypothetical protein WDN72_01035 [Alphaproteobacteria bacterium]